MGRGQPAPSSRPTLLSPPPCAQARPCASSAETGYDGYRVPTSAHAGTATSPQPPSRHGAGFLSSGLRSGPGRAGAAVAVPRLHAGITTGATVQEPMRAATRRTLPASRQATGKRRLHADVHLPAFRPGPRSGCGPRHPACFERSRRTRRGAAWKRQDQAARHGCDRDAAAGPKWLTLASHRPPFSSLPPAAVCLGAHVPRASPWGE